MYLRKVELDQAKLELILLSDVVFFFFALSGLSRGLLFFFCFFFLLLLFLQLSSSFQVNLGYIHPTHIIST